MSVVLDCQVNPLSKSDAFIEIETGEPLTGQELNDAIASLSWEFLLDEENWDIPSEFFSHDSVVKFRTPDFPHQPTNPLSDADFIAMFEPNIKRQRSDPNPGPELEPMSISANIHKWWNDSAYMSLE
jgi:hypothetical protein